LELPSRRLLTETDRRHYSRRISSGHACNDRALLHVARDNGGVVTAHGQRALLRVEAQIRLPRAGVWAMAPEAVLCEYGPDVAVVADLRRNRLCCLLISSLRSRGGQPEKCRRAEERQYRGMKSNGLFHFV